LRCGLEVSWTADLTLMDMREGLHCACASSLISGPDRARFHQAESALSAASRELGQRSGGHGVHVPTPALHPVVVQPAADAARAGRRVQPNARGPRSHADRALLARRDRANRRRCSWVAAEEPDHVAVGQILVDRDDDPAPRCEATHCLQRRRDHRRGGVLSHVGRGADTDRQLSV
jgi:hypothetical protein